MRLVGALWTITVIGAIKATQGFSQDPKDNPVAEEQNFRLISIF